MTGQQDQDTDRYGRARSGEEPGAHSGGEQQAQDRTIPGEGSAKEGYQTGRGTTAGNPLEGVEAPADAEDEESGDTEDRQGS
ncbi:hypothetical protein C1708_29145 [Streptomyces sp. DH-12]|uniref:hypothetical protein n=1 Tax=unclassified Streptomyces TaxID=2593676 RepID=UPI000CCE179D|nr:hypothetical protein [Streptomyces sp. DH-12]PNV35883.1 hypothetical protein C1708_29145 [Streptomyces sp. DH-12]